MDLGLVGLGKMGGNMARRLARGGHRVLGYARTRESVLALEKDGVGAAESLPDLVARLQPPRAVWLMLPAGTPTEETVTRLGGLLSRGDLLVDGGNTYYKDDVRRAAALEPKGI